MVATPAGSPENSSGPELLAGSIPAVARGDVLAGQVMPTPLHIEAVGIAGLAATRDEKSATGAKGRWQRE